MYWDLGQCYVIRLFKYTHNPNQTHWSAVVRLFKYIKGISHYNLYYSGSPTEFEGYCDESWILDTLDTKSISGYVFILGGGANS